MSMTKKMVRRILFYAEEMPPDEAALAYLVEVASFLEASVTVVSVVRPVPQQALFSRRDLAFDEIHQLMIEDRKRELEGAVEGLRDVGVDIRVGVLVGTPSDAIIRAVMRDDYDLVIKSRAPGASLRRALFGGTDVRLMRACPCEVEILGDSVGKHPRRAIAAIDYEPARPAQAQLNRAILEACVLSLAGPPTELHILHAWTLYGEALISAGRGRITPQQYRQVLVDEGNERQGWLETLVAEFRATLGDDLATLFDPHVEVIHGEAVNVIPQRAEELDAEFLLVGTASHTGVGGLVMGNTVEEILKRVECSVIAVKPEGFESTVEAKWENA